MVDVTGMLERVDLAALVEWDLGGPVRREGRWLKWRCPFHADGKTPSLGVANNRWKCFGCGRSGDAIDWLREREGLSFPDACERLSAMSFLPMSPTPVQRQPSVPSVTTESWQRQTQAVMAVCEATLWSSAGAKARSWLNRRGLTDETVRRWHLGFNQHSSKIAGLWVPRGIVIPYLVGGQVWHLKVRRAAGQPKYVQVKGSQLALFGADTLAGRDVAAVTEGEFDAMLLHQEAGNLVGVVTLGSASARLPDAWVPYLLGVKRLLIAYDTDAAGSEGASAWQSLTAKAQRLLPLAGKDITDFYLAGGDLRAWIRFALTGAQMFRVPPVPAAAPALPAPWVGQQVRIEDLPDLRARFGLQVVGGDPDLEGDPWRPKVYLKESAP
jgi:DNA primase